MRAGRLAPYAACAVIIGLLVLGDAGAASASSATPQSGKQVTLTISADIDGRSELTISGRNAVWKHLTQAAPVRHQGGATVTKIGKASWTPSWPDAGENRDCGCFSDVFHGVSPAVPSGGPVRFKAVSCREACSMATRNGKVVITVDDNLTASSALYVFTLTYVVKGKSRAPSDHADPQVDVGAGKSLGTGDSGPAVEELQRALKALGLYKGKIDGTFGKDLAAAVAAYQVSKGKTADGRVGPDTAALINASVAAPEKVVVPARQSPLSLRDSGSAVADLQKALKALGLFKGKIDGTFGKDTAAAVTAYQRSKGLKADGEVGPKTAALINASGAAPAKSAGGPGQALALSDSGPAVTQLQKALAALGLYKGKADGVFGKDLSAAVAAYQQSKGIAADGRVGPDTAGLINAAVEAPAKITVPAGHSLSLSDSGAGVENLQKSLAALGLYKGRIDGVFGKDLTAAVSAFQKSKGVAADGTVGPKTASLINAAVVP